MVRKLSSWNLFVQKVKKENPSMSFSEVLKKASELKKQGKMPDSPKSSSIEVDKKIMIKSKKQIEEVVENEDQGENIKPIKMSKGKSKHSKKSVNKQQSKKSKKVRKSRKSRKSRKNKTKRRKH